MPESRRPDLYTYLDLRMLVVNSGVHVVDHSSNFRSQSVRRLNAIPMWQSTLDRHVAILSIRHPRSIDPRLSSLLHT